MAAASGLLHYQLTTEFGLDDDSEPFHPGGDGFVTV
jgi:hypothetical protein